jgi:DNA invertase Pin-like site-specific DNA recombinase
MNDALGYIRVSSEEQADRELGLEAQRQRIAAFSWRSWFASG